jgi:hypothetical protein
MKARDVRGSDLEIGLALNPLKVFFRDIESKEKKSSMFFIRLQVLSTHLPIPKCQSLWYHNAKFPGYPCTIPSKCHNAGILEPIIEDRQFSQN